MFVKVRILTKDFYALKVFLPCFIFSASSLSFFTLNESLQNALSLLFPPLFLFCLLRSKRSIEKRRSTHTHTHTLPGRERHGWILDHVLAQGTDRRVVVRFRFSRRRVTRLRPAGEKHVEKRCGADSASERGVCRRRFERWQIVMGGHTRQRGEGEYRTRLANNRGVTTTGIEVFLIYYVILLARKKRILLLAHTGSTIVRRIHLFFALLFPHIKHPQYDKLYHHHHHLARRCRLLLLLLAV